MDSSSNESPPAEKSFFSQIMVTLGIALPYDDRTPSSEELASMYKREIERLRNRMLLAQKLESLRNVYNLAGLIEPAVVTFPFCSSDTENSRGIDAIPNELIKACFELRHPVPDEYVVLFTSTPFIDGVLAIIDSSRLVLVQDNAARILANNLGRDPFAALIAVLIAKFITTFNSNSNSSVSLLTITETLDAIRKGSGHWLFDAMEYLDFDRAEIGKILTAKPRKPDLKATSYADTLAKNDTLGFKPFVESFARVILHRETKTPLVISVTGEWGKGKSSFMGFLRDRLEEHGREKGAEYTGDFLVPRAVTVWFDAWRYNSEERIYAALLETVAREIERRFTPWAWLLYRLRTPLTRLLTWRVAYELITHALIVPLVLIVAATAVYMFRITGCDSWSIEDFVKSSITGGGQVGFVFGLLYVAWRILLRVRLPLGLDLKKIFEEKDHTERLGYAAVFEEDLKRRINQLARMPSASLRPLNKDGGLGKAPPTVDEKNADLGDAPSSNNKAAKGDANIPAEDDGNRVVIFIDDLDRCRPDVIVDILEAIKIIFDTPNIVFVLGMDEQYVRAGIYSKYKDHIVTQQSLYPAGLTELPQGGSTPLADLWPRRYLEKVIQLPFCLPDADADQISQMVSDIMAVREKPLASDSNTASSGKDEHSAIGAGTKINPQMVLAEADNEDVANLLLKAAMDVTPVHGANPRRVKSFVNRCRLGLYLLKLEMPEMLSDDYKEAIDYFIRWERQEAGMRDRESELPSGDWGKRLQRVKGCVFRGKHPEEVRNP